MRLPYLAVALLFTVAAAADELYVPMAARTEVEIVNTSSHRAAIAVEILGGATARYELEAGQRLQWSGHAHDELRVLRISGDASLDAVAVSRTATATVSLPVLTADDAVEAASATRHRDGPWRSGLLVVNPAERSAVATVDESLQSVAPRGVLRGSRIRSTTPLLVFAYDVNEVTGALHFKVAAQKRRAVRSGPPRAPQTQTVVLTPSKDNTLYETPDGGASNGAGWHLFAGTTQSLSRRRALLAFDVAAQLPPGSRITKATLTMRVSMTISGAEPATLHRLTADWGQGDSDAGTFRDGGGAPSSPGDATWLHTFFPDRRWNAQGGDFDPSADATAAVDRTIGTWESAAMIARVQQWLDQPATNFGWIVVGNESRSGSAKRFDSREMQPPISRPSLTIEFQP